MNSENEKLRVLLKRLYPSVSISDQVRIDEALSQQAEPVTAQDEREAVSRDAELYGIGFMVDGVRVHPSRVTVQYSATRPRRPSSSRWSNKPSGSAFMTNCQNAAKECFAG